MSCKNCQTELTLEDKFCNRCGAKVIRNRLTLRNLWDDFSEQFLNYDNKLLKTFVALFKKPDEVIGDYINGTRKKYVNVVTYFTIAVTLTGFQLFVLQKFVPETLDITSLMPKNSVNKAMDMNWMYEYYSLFVLINMPLYALMAKLTFIGLKKLNYTEHLVVITYAVSQFSIANFLIITVAAFAGVNYYIIGNIINLFMFVYVSYTYKKLFPLTLSQLALRCMLFGAVLVVLMIVAGIIQLAVLYLTGDFEKIIEAEKAKKDITYIASSIIYWTS